MLITPEIEIFQPSHTGRSQRWKSLSKHSLFGILLGIRANELDRKINLLFLNLLYEYCQNLSFDINEPKLSFLEAQLLANLVLAES